MSVRRFPLVCVCAITACGGDDGSASDGTTDGSSEASEDVGSAATGPSSTSAGSSADGSSDSGTDSTEATGSPPESPEGTWVSLAPLGLGPRQETGVAALAGQVYVVGGFTEVGLVGRVEAYDPGTDAWREVADFPVAGVHHANTAAALGHVWVLGYLQGNTFAAGGSVFAYDPSADAWVDHGTMPTGSERGASAVAVLDGVIYVIGGFRAGQALTDAWSFDPAAEQWVPLPDFPRQSDHMVAAAGQGKLWVIGGRDSGIANHVANVDVFDPATGNWQAGPAMPTSRGGMAASALGPFVFVAGGEGNANASSGVFPQLEVLDTRDGTWTTLTDMPMPSHGTGGAAIDNVLYVPGGADQAGFGAVDIHQAWVLDR